MPPSLGRGIRPCTCNPCNGPVLCEKSDQKIRKCKWITNNGTGSLILSLAPVVGALRLLIICRAFLFTRASSVVTHSTPALQSFTVFATRLGVVFIARSLRVWNSCWRNSKSRRGKWEWNDRWETRSSEDKALDLKDLKLVKKR